MPGTGEYDVTAPSLTTKFRRPSTRRITSSGRRTTAGHADYPYYIGTTSNFFDPGYRANEIHRVLSQDRKLTAADMAALPNRYPRLPRL